MELRKNARKCLTNAQTAQLKCWRWPQLWRSEDPLRRRPLQSHGRDG